MGIENVLQAVGFLSILYMIGKAIAYFTGMKKVASIYQRLEIQMLMASIGLNQYKYHAIKILEISYSEDPTKTEEFKRIEKKIIEKFDTYGDSYIQNLISYLPYKTEYNDWQSALQYMERLIKDSK